MQTKKGAYNTISEFILLLLSVPPYRAQALILICILRLISVTSVPILWIEYIEVFQSPEITNNTILFHIEFILCF